MPAVSGENPIWEKESNKSRVDQNLENGYSKQLEQEESWVKIEEGWISIGDECFENPISITSNATLKQVVKEFVIPDSVSDQYDHLNEIQQNDKREKRKRNQFEAEKQDDAVPDMSYAFIKNRSSNLEENYVNLEIINERFMVSTVVDLGEKEYKVYTIPCGFRTKRRNLERMNMAQEQDEKALKYAFIRIHSYNSEETYVKLIDINQRFVLEKREHNMGYQESANKSYYKFETKRPYLYDN